MKKKLSYMNYLYILWALIIVVAIIYTTFSSYKTKSSMYDKEIEASELSKKCLEEISKYNKERGMEQSKYDYLDSYLLGSNLKNLLTTTSGSMESKRTSLNPNFAGLFVKMINECDVKENDEVAICVSGSFPALNISLLCAIEVMDLKTVVMSSIGASQLGANDSEFVFPEWVDYLYNKGLLNKRVDYVSFGGEYDTIEGFYDYTTKSTDLENKEKLTEIKNRLINSGLKFLEIENYKENINKRMNIYNTELKNVKLFINIGGNLIGLGRGNSSKYYYSGIINENYLKNSKTYDKENSGLIERFLIDGVKTISILNIKGICKEYNMEYNPDTISSITGEDDIYYDIKYKKIVPCITIVLSIMISSYIIITKRKEKKLN